MNTPARRWHPITPALLKHTPHSSHGPISFIHVDTTRTEILQQLLAEYTNLNSLPVYTHLLFYLSLPDTWIAVDPWNSRALWVPCSSRSCQDTEAQSESQRTLLNTSKKDHLPHSKTITSVIIDYSCNKHSLFNTYLCVRQFRNSPLQSNIITTWSRISLMI